MLAGFEPEHVALPMVIVFGWVGMGWASPTLLSASVRVGCVIMRDCIYDSCAIRKVEDHTVHCNAPAG